MHVVLDGLEIEVLEEGEGPRVLLVHGSAGDRRTWNSLRPRLTDDFRLLSYSRRYHWPNPAETDETEYTTEGHVDDLIAVIGRLTSEPINIVGHSYGAFVTLMLALRHPGMVRRQVLIEPPAVSLFLSDPPNPAELLKVLMTKPRLGLGLLKFGAMGVVPATKAAEQRDMDKAIRTFGKAVLGNKAFKQMSGERWRQAEENNIRAEYLSQSFAPLTDDEVRNITTPTLLISGTESVAVWPLLSDHLDGLLPTSEHVRIPGASHIVHEDQPDLVADRISAFLSD